MTSNSNPSPRSGDDTYDLIDNALATLAQRRRLWLGHDLTAITLVISLIEQAERFLPQLVHDARANGHTWPEIAHALGTSPDEARLRFDPDSPIADSRWPTNRDHHTPIKRRVRSLLTNIDHEHDRQVRSQHTNIRGHFSRTKPPQSL